MNSAGDCCHIASIVVDEISTGLKEYVRREFPVANAFFIDDDGRIVVDRFLDKKDDMGRATSLVKGPRVELMFPFKKSDVLSTGVFCCREYV